MKEGGGAASATASENGEGHGVSDARYSREFPLKFGRSGEMGAGKGRKGTVRHSTMHIIRRMCIKS